MPFFALAPLGVMVVAANMQPACPRVPAPQITVQTARQAAKIHHELSKDDLKAVKPDTMLPYQMQDLSHVETGGMMRGDIHVQYDIATAAVPGNTAATINQNCVRYERITLTLALAPEIFVASDFAPGSCWYEAILQHEQSHVDMDAQMIEKYAGRIHDGLTLAFSQEGDAIEGPVVPKKVADLKAAMGKHVMDMTDMLIGDMARERQQVQQGVDSFRGYGYLMNQCAGTK